MQSVRDMEEQGLSRLEEHSTQEYFFSSESKLILKYLREVRKSDLIMGKIITNGLSQLKLFTTLSFIFTFTFWKRPCFMLVAFESH